MNLRRTILLTATLLLLNFGTACLNANLPGKDKPSSPGFFGLLLPLVAGGITTTTQTDNRCRLGVSKVGNCILSSDTE